MKAVNKRSAGVCYLITCEHGGNKVPAEYRLLFKGRQALLHSHRGWDPGALRLARELARRVDGKLIYSTTSRLLVDLNRSLHHSRLFSEVTRPLGRIEKEKIVNGYYRPYREEVERYIRQRIKKGKIVIHFSAHSFTPRLRGITRDGDIGLLYDPSRPSEKKFCDHLQKELRRELGGLRVRKNYPYHGSADGLTTYLRKVFPDNHYLGIELELNQRLANGEKKRRPVPAVRLAEAIGKTLENRAKNARQAFNPAKNQ